MKLRKGLFCLATMLAISVVGITPALAAQSAALPVMPNNEAQEMLAVIQPRADYFVVNTNNVHFRRNPGSSTEIIGQLHRGTVVTDLRSSRTVDGITWNQVSHNGITGWIASQFLDWAG